MKTVFNKLGFAALPFVVVALAAVAGCGDDSSDGGDPDGGSHGDAGERDAGGRDAAADAGAPAPRYVVSTSVLSEDTATSYLAVVDSLDDGPRVELGDALELGGGASAYGPAGKGVVYATSSEDGTMTEVTFDADGKPDVGRVVSFTQLGITATTGGNVHYFVSPTKAYFVSQDTLEIVVWNPEEMQVIDTVPLDLEPHLAAKDGYFYFYPRPIVAGDRLVLIANQSDESDIEGPAVVSVIDTATDRVLSTTAEPRCHAFLQSAVDARGDRYFASSDYSAAVRFLVPDDAPAPCMLRMKKGQTEFDPSWSRSLDDALDSSLWTGLTPGKDGAMFVQSIAEDAPAVQDAEEPFDVTIATPWRWYTLIDGDADPQPIDADYLDAPPFFPAIEVDDRAYGSLWDESDTTLVDLSGSAVPQKGRIVPGFVYNIVRIR
jgi:hypothetical protein